MKKLLPKTKNNTQGFTLVELLVVIAIIAILSVIGVTVFSGVQKNARDARRRADVDAIITALETRYTATNSAYPTPPIDNSWFASGTQPKDPSNNTSTYTFTGGGSSNVCVCTPVQLENGGNNFTNNTCATAGTALYCKKGSQI